MVGVAGKPDTDLRNYWGPFCGVACPQFVCCFLSALGLRHACGLLTGSLQDAMDRSEFHCAAGDRVRLCAPGDLRTINLGSAGCTGRCSACSHLEWVSDLRPQLS